MKPHAFIAMPFGIKPGHDGTPIDFNLVFERLIRPALEQAGCTVFRADEETRAGDIRTDMFQELLVADLVLADLTLDNPNVWYELGVRHALRARGVVLIQGPRATQPFDIYTDRKLRYAIKDGAPDPSRLDVDRDRLAAMARDTLAANSVRKVSPVYVLLDHLREPQWRELLLKGDNEFSRAYDAWCSRLEVARQKNRPGDILVLAAETPTRALALEARRAAAESLMKLRQFDFALEQIDAALAIDDCDRASRIRRALCLARLRRFEEAREAVQQLEESFPRDPDICTLAGRIEMQNWIQRWRGDPVEDGEAAAAAADGATLPGTTAGIPLRQAAADEEAGLAYAIEPFRTAFTLQPSNYYAGIHWLMLAMVHAHLTGRTDSSLLEQVTGGVHWSCLSARERDARDYAARASYAELCLLCFDAAQARSAWSAAVAAADRDWFALDSSRRTLAVLRDLAFRPQETATALSIVDREIARTASPFRPRQVLLFSGHMTDAATRPSPRFPSDKVDAAAARLAAALDQGGAGPDDLALCQAAAGGDLLFLEACQARGVPCQLMLPFPEPEFIERSVLPVKDGEAWRERYFAVKAKLALPPREMPVELGSLPEAANAYERCNSWLLNTALAWGIDRVRFFTLWNGGGGDGPGGTAHMYEEVKRRTGRVHWIDVRTL
ncbi:MAG: tetratricopeptide repeat-containing protein [bacterium]|jgi:tetratricopeptide (TPR) repeat protein|nr:tetratricopeptide repeat protein [Betaproteobacteria bacterium]